MKKSFIKVFKFLLFLSIGIFIFWLIYKDQDINRIKKALKNDVNYFWVYISLIIGIFSHISRAIRWQILIKPVSHKPRFINTFLAVMIGYFMNLALPRLGEVSKCGVLTRYEKISFSKLLGTVVTERIIDLISLLILLIIVLISNFELILDFIDNNEAVKNKLIDIINSPFLYISFLIVLALLFLFRNRIKESGPFKKLIEILNNFKKGLLSIRSIDKKGWFIFHSIAIWVSYYIMLYVIFFAFNFTKDLSPIAGLTTFVLASFGMVAPVQGGIGAWHFMTQEALSLYNVPYEDGVIFAFVAHASMTLMIIILGIISLVVLPFINQRNQNSVKQKI